jgi:hypothetical protein
MFSEQKIYKEHALEILQKHLLPGQIGKGKPV